MNLFNQVFKSLMFWTSFPKSNSKFSLLYAVSSWPTAALYEAINSVCMPGDGLVTQSLSDSFRFHGLLPARLLCPWDSPGKNTGVGCQARLQGIFSTQGLNFHLLPSPALQADSPPTEPPGKPLCSIFYTWESVPLNSLPLYCPSTPLHW